jgi:polyribonucleotide nucleotidyltransferase
MYAHFLYIYFRIETVANQVPEATVKEAMRMAHAAVQDIIKAQMQLLRSDREIATGSNPANEIVYEHSDAGIAAGNQKRLVEQRQQFVSSDDGESITILDSTSTHAKTTTNISPDAVVALASSIIKSKDGKMIGFSVPDELKAAAEGLGLEEARKIFFDTAAGRLQKADRGRAEGALISKISSGLAADPVWGQQHALLRSMAVEAVMSRAMRAVMLEGVRVDGRAPGQLRELQCHPDVLPSVHGSSFFRRGETQVLCTTTLGELTLLVLPYQHYKLI